MPGITFAVDDVSEQFEPGRRDPTGRAPNEHVPASDCPESDRPTRGESGVDGGVDGGVEGGDDAGGASVGGPSGGVPTALDAQIPLLRELFEDCIDASPGARAQRLARARGEGVSPPVLARVERLLRIADEERELEERELRERELQERELESRNPGERELEARGPGGRSTHEPRDGMRGLLRRRRAAAWMVGPMLAVVGVLIVVRAFDHAPRPESAPRLNRARSSLPVEWSTAAGGNGHWYQFIAFGPLESREPELVALRARRQGARLAEAETDGEARFIAGLAGASGAGGREVGAAGGLAGTEGFILEWSADCDGDGRVDFGSIRAGRAADANGNGVPDQCE